MLSYSVSGVQLEVTHGKILGPREFLGTVNLESGVPGDVQRGGEQLREHGSQRRDDRWACQGRSSGTSGLPAAGSPISCIRTSGESLRTFASRLSCFG